MSQGFTKTTAQQIQVTNTSGTSTNTGFGAASVPVYSLPLLNGTNASLKSVNVAPTTATNTSVVALVASKRIKVMSFMVSSVGTNTVSFTDGSGGTTLFAINLAAGAGVTQNAGLAVSFPSFLFGTTAGTALFITTAQATQVYCSVTYWTDDAA